MAFSLFLNAKRFIAGAAGECDDAALAEVVNGIRQEWYSWYEKLPLFRMAEECFQVQDFAVDCNRCHETYRGVTLPRDYAAVEAMWYDSRPVQLFDRWRQWQYGMSSPCECGLNSYDMGEFPTERDLQPGQPRRLMFWALDSRDVGKRLDLRGQDVFNRPFHGSYKLESTPQLTEVALVTLERQGGVSKDPTAGRVFLADETGRVLSIYAPEETVPTYKRSKITGLPDSCQYVNIRAARLFQELFDDYDVVETDNSQAWQAMARAHRLQNMPTKGAAEIKSIGADKLLAENLLRGDDVRLKGKHTVAEIRTAMPLFGSRRLNRSRW